MILPNTKLMLNRSGQALKNIVKLYWIPFSRLIRAEEVVVISSGPYGGGGETFITYSSVLGRSWLCVTMKLKIPIFCWININVKCVEKMRKSEIGSMQL